MRVTYYFDFGSPYAYLGWQRIRAHPARYREADVQFVPCSAGHIFKMDGSAPNTTLPNQAKYLYRDVSRWAERLGVPFAPPQAGTKAAMPVNSINAMRLHFAAHEQGKGEAWREAVFMAYFRDGEDISDPEVLGELLRDTGIEADAHDLDPAWKEALIDSTAAAYDDGAPGVPYTVIEHDGVHEHFWGQDRLDWVEARLERLRVLAQS